ncbi:DUF2167 domain-containing protein [Lysobacter sp. FW306-1B-D06B]|uniref:DUF2167 domain-containing protein n=1 Tax=Lysobacter sp. FW306-1B-D06B TaxID=3140250 RepID=UPI003140244D
MASLHFRDGHIEVPSANARMRLGENFHYLEKADARKVLERLWGNPPDDSVLGMVVPKDVPLTDENSWAAVVTYSDDGYITDKDAASIDYDELMADLKSDDVKDNEARAEEGYETLHLIGWAEEPRYDDVGKKLYWAKELKAADADINTLNYDIRVLGRRGYLGLNAVASMDDLPAVRRGMSELLQNVEFERGARYADYNESSDKLATYGLAALVGGGLAAKAGLFGKLALVLLKAWKLVALAFVALFAMIGKLFARKKRGVVR